MASKSMAKNLKCKDTKHHLMLAALLLAIVASIILIIFPPFTLTGAFSAGGVNWENKLEIPADSGQTAIRMHLIFNQYKTENCADNVYVEVSGQSVPFKIENDIIAGGLCTETDVIFDNDIFGPATYNIYYSKVPAISEEQQPANLKLFPEPNFAVQATNVTDCLTISASGAYILNQSISGNLSNSICINIRAANVSLDCANYNVTGIYASAYGVYTNSSNTTIQNCNVLNYSYAISLGHQTLGGNAVNSTVNNCTVYNSSNGIHLDNSAYSNVTNNNVFNVNNSIRLKSWYSNAINNTIYNVGTGITLSQDGNYIVFNNTINNSTYNGLILSSSFNNSITNNTINNSNWCGVYIGYSNGYSNYNNLTNNTVRNSNYSGVCSDNSSNNTLTSNIITNSNQSGINFNSSANNTLINNTINNSALHGIYLEFSSNNTIINNTANNNNQCIFLEASSDYNTFTNNVASNSTEWAIYIISSANNTFINQTLASYPTTISFTYSGDLNITGVETPPDPSSTGYLDIGKWVNATNNTVNAWLFMNVSYTQDDLDNANVDEATLSIARNNGTWETNTSKFANGSGVAVGNYYVYANITSFGSIFAPLGGSAAEVSGCRNITAEGYYSLTQNLVGNQSSGICIDIQAANVTLDCLNTYNLTGNVSDGTIGIDTNSSNTTIQNCLVYNYSTSINVNKSSSNNIINNTALSSINNGPGIVVVSNNNTQVINNTIYNGTGDGLDFEYNINLTVTNNEIHKNGNIGIYCSAGNNTHFNDNVIRDNLAGGIFLKGDNNDALINNTASNNTDYGIYLEDSSNNTITNNTAYNNTWDFNSSNGALNNTAYNLVLLTANVSFNGDDFAINASTNPPAAPGNISLFFNATNTSDAGWAMINVSYTEPLPGSMDENTLKLYHYNGTAWEQLANTGVDPTNNYVWGNATSFSTFAPLGKTNSTCSLTISPSSPINYGTLSNASCTCTNPEAPATLYRNSTNVTAGENNINVTLPAGAWDYICNVTETENYTSASNTTTYSVNKTTTADVLGQMNLTINGAEANQSFTYPAFTNVTGWNSIPQLDSNFTLYLNSSAIGSTNPVSDLQLFGAGLYRYEYNTSGNENYSAASKQYNLTINQNTSTTCSLDITPPSVTYGSSSTATCSCTSTDVNATLYRNGTDVTATENGIPAVLPVGTWDYTCNVTVTQNYTSASNSSNITVQPTPAAGGGIFIPSLRSEFNCTWINGFNSVRAGQTVSAQFSDFCTMLTNIQATLRKASPSFNLNTYGNKTLQPLKSPKETIIGRFALVAEPNIDASLTIDFRINNSIIDTRGFSREAGIFLQRYIGESWQKQTTTFTGKDGNSSYYRATGLEGFSNFVITGEKVAPPPVVIPPPPPAPAIVAAPPYAILGLIVLLVLILITAGYHYYERRLPRRPRIPAIPTIPKTAIPKLPKPPVRAPAAKLDELQRRIESVRRQLEVPSLAILSRPLEAPKKAMTTVTKVITPKVKKPAAIKPKKKLNEKKFYKTLKDVEKQLK